MSEEKIKSIMDRLKKATPVKEASVLSESKLFKNRHTLTTKVPALNIALAGSVKGRYKSGVLTIAGPSKHFKTAYALELASSYLAENPDAVLVFFDNEFGSPQSYFHKAHIPLNRVFHVPFKTVEQLQHLMSMQLDEFTRKDKVIMIVDSIGNAASNKETADALKGDAKVDMTRAKAIKALSRIINHDLIVKDKFLIMISHTYQTQEMFSKTVMSGGTGIYYISNDIWFISRVQDKDKTTKELHGFEFKIKIEKSRLLREGSVLPISVSFDLGIHQYSGLFDDALEGGFIVENGKINKGKTTVYSPVDKSTGEVLTVTLTKDDQEHSAEFWEPIMKQQAYLNFIEDKYLAFKDDGTDSVIAEDDDDDEDE